MRRCGRIDDISVVKHCLTTRTHGALVEIERAIAAAKLKHNGFLKELGLSPLP